MLNPSSHSNFDDFTCMLILFLFRNKVEIDTRISVRECLLMTSDNFELFLTHNLVSVKGQIISKRLLVSSDSSKKRTNKFGFLPNSTRNKGLDHSGAGYDSSGAFLESSFSSKKRTKHVA